MWDSGSVNEERRKILEMVESGRISAEEAADLLRWVPNSGEFREQAPGDIGTTESSRSSTTSRPPYWLYTVAAGTAIIAMGGAVVSSSAGREQASVGTWLCGWIPLAVGITLTVIGVWIRSAPWVHLRVRDRDHDLSFGVPLPLGLAASVLGMARQFVPGFAQTGIDEVLLALREGLSSDEPIVIEVDDADGGENVRISFG